MLILCSNGLSSDTLLCVIKEKTAGCKTAALVVTANHQYKENSFHVERCTEELEALGLSVQTFDVDTQPAEALYNYDVVEFIGGNPYYLLKSVRESNAAEVLKNIAEKELLAQDGLILLECAKNTSLSIENSIFLIYKEK